MVNIQEAKTHLSRLTELAAAGETIVIGKAGKPIAQLVAWKPESKPRTGGGWSGKITMPEDFNIPDIELERLFYGGEDQPVVTNKVAEDPSEL